MELLLELKHQIKEGCKTDCKIPKVKYGACGK